MEKIDFLNPLRLRNDEHYQFMTDFKTLVEKAAPTELDIEDIYTEFKTAFEEEDKAMKIELGSSLSAGISNFDHVRDKTWNAIIRKVEACVISPIETEVIAAEALKRILDLYGDKRDAPYNEETSAITNLVADLLMPANKPYLETLGLASWVSALKTQNENFQTEFNKRNQELAGKLSGDMRIFRKPVNELYKKIVNRINATIELNLAKPVVTGFVKELNEKVGYFQNTIAIRKGRKLAASKARLQPEK